jgi:hypothetical protein
LRAASLGHRAGAASPLDLAFMNPLTHTSVSPMMARESESRHGNMTKMGGCMTGGLVRRFASVFAATIVAFGVVTGSAFAQDDKLKAKPFGFDPNNQCDDRADWRAKIGLPDVGSSDHGLVLRKGCATSVVAAAGAVIDGAQGQAAGTQIGFDIRNDSPCTGGAPRFNLSASDGFHFIGGCGNDAERTPVPGNPGWTRVRFELQDPGEAFPVVNAAAVIEQLVLIVDEQGEYVVDNIYVNGTVIGKPGNSK